MRINKDCEKYLRSVGARIRSMRKKKGWTLEETEEHGYPTWQHLQAIENGKNITLATLWQVAKLYGVSTGELLKGL
jgi:transcriptional regulator with XRE-family HTH domain